MLKIKIKKLMSFVVVGRLVIKMSFRVTSKKEKEVRMWKACASRPYGIAEASTNTNTKSRSM